jgi:hypothetical protein
MIDNHLSNTNTLKILKNLSNNKKEKEVKVVPKPNFPRNILSNSPLQSFNHLNIDKSNKDNGLNLRVHDEIERSSENETDSKLEHDIYTNQFKTMKKKRFRRSYNCGPCKRHKIKCDMQIPCGNCLKYNRVDNCKNEPPNPPTKEQYRLKKEKKQKYSKKIDDPKLNVRNKRTLVPKFQMYNIDDINNLNINPNIIAPSISEFPPPSSVPCYPHTKNYQNNQFHENQQSSLDVLNYQRHILKSYQVPAPNTVQHCLLQNQFHNSPILNYNSASFQSPHIQLVDQLQPQTKPTLLPQFYPPSLKHTHTTSFELNGNSSQSMPIIFQNGICPNFQLSSPTNLKPNVPPSMSFNRMSSEQIPGVPVYYSCHQNNGFLVTHPHFGFQNSALTNKPINSKIHQDKTSIPTKESNNNSVYYPIIQQQQLQFQRANTSNKISPDDLSSINSSEPKNFPVNSILNFQNSNST